MSNNRKQTKLLKISIYTILTCMAIFFSCSKQYETGEKEEQEISINELITTESENVVCRNVFQWIYQIL